MLLEFLDLFCLQSLLFALTIFPHQLKEKKPLAWLTPLAAFKWKKGGTFSSIRNFFGGLLNKMDSTTLKVDIQARKQALFPQMEHKTSMATCKRLSLISVQAFASASAGI